ncbi:hypothetical protein [uncultured archaeal virus]|uniref:Uncharacterized protein n=1 Tax=uncultured archaeal virus TaxID=1960247 RepID=A0A8B0LNL0_9VIRU|nr:hypothetical protein [uncultured archaeal virus]
MSKIIIESVRGVIENNKLSTNVILSYFSYLFTAFSGLCIYGLSNNICLQPCLITCILSIVVALSFIYIKTKFQNE